MSQTEQDLAKRNALAFGIGEISQYLGSSGRKRSWRAGRTRSVIVAMHWVVAIGPAGGFLFYLLRLGP